jgi:hypothetical protein
MLFWQQLQVLARDHPVKNKCSLVLLEGFLLMSTDFDIEPSSPAIVSSAPPKPSTRSFFAGFLFGFLIAAIVALVVGLAVGLSVNQPYVFVDVTAMPMSLDLVSRNFSGNEKRKKKKKSFFSWLPKKS